MTEPTPLPAPASSPAWPHSPPSPKKKIWLASQKSARTRRAYRQDVAHFMRALGIASPAQLRQVDHRAVIAWERIMRGQQGTAASTVRRRLAALSSLFKHLVRHGLAARNPVVDVQRPAINREEGSTAAFSKAEARRLLDAPAADTVAGLRDRAILSVGLQVGLRRAEIAALTVGDLHQNRGLDALRLTGKGGRRASAPTSIWRGMAATMADRCLGRCAAMPRRTTPPAGWTRTRFKRQMYGRAHLDLLRARLLAPRVKPAAELHRD